jgi:deoxyribodipyrimidine photo-lyase
MLLGSRLLGYRQIVRIPSPIHGFTHFRSKEIKQATSSRNLANLKQQNIKRSTETSSKSPNMSKRTTYERSELGHPTTKRAKQIDSDTPYAKLQTALEVQNSVNDIKKVAHWFRPKDLRIHDNTALHHASQLAQECNAPLICVYQHCPAEESWHGTSPARTDFMLEALKLMQKELKKLGIPLVFLNTEERDGIVPNMVEWCKEEGISHVSANFEYEIDELRRDTTFVEKTGDDIQVSLHHDQTVVEPGTMLTGGGTPMKVFTPYHRVWLQLIKDNPDMLDTRPAPAKNSGKSKKGIEHLFGNPVPKPGKDKLFANDEDRKRIRGLWPAGHAAAVDRLNHFLGEKITDYAATRSNPAEDSTSRLSAYFSSGQLSVREALSAVRSKSNKNSADFSEKGARPGVYSWVRELVFRELYRQTTVCTPHTSMNLPQNLKFDRVQWEDDEKGWEKWIKGQTGEPFIDAGMRQLTTEGYMHNRLRMNVSSYFYCNLLLDYRRGERYFAETLIDWDLANNTQGWEPSYTVFNPVSQAEKNDPNGDYIRRWVPELKDVKGKAVFAPYARLGEEEFEKLGYPKPHVDWKETKQRCMERYKSDMKDAES